ETACATWNRNESIIVVCAYGTRSGKAAVLLGAGGFRKVASLNGGMTRWAAEGDPRTQIMGDRAIEDAASWQAMGI
ncbi:MAG: rhodanese-like domain-containing protein, partial [Myxococcota bacterium]